MLVYSPPGPQKQMVFPAGARPPSAKAVNSVTLEVLLPTGRRKRHVFPRGQCPAAEVAKICQECVIRHSEDEYMVLVAKSNERRLISEHFLAKATETSELKLVDGNSLVKSIVAKIETLRSLLSTSQPYSPFDFHDCLENVMINCSLPGDIGAWFVGELVQLGGLEVMLKTFVLLHKEGTDEAVICLSGPLLGAFATKFQFECGTEWLEQRLDEFITMDFFRAILANIFGRRVSRLDAQCDFSANSRRLAFAFASSILKSFPETGAICHRAASQAVGKKGAYPVTYYDLMCQGASDADNQQHTICMALFNIMLQTNTSKREMIQAVKRTNGGGDLVKQQNLDEAQRATFMEELWLSNLVAAATDAELSTRDGPDGINSKDHLTQLENQIKLLTDRKWKLDNELRKAHQVSCKLMEFVSVKNQDGTPNDLVNKSLNAIIRYGWDSVQWSKGYTVLHFAAECMSDPAVIELLALLAIDIDCRDNDGMRPIDYARREGHYVNEETLNKLRRKMALDERATTVLSSKAGGALSTRRDELPEDLTPALRASMEAVLQIGWKQIKWPNNVTALHMAAECGKLQAVKLLLENIDGVKADINKVDDHGSRPLDYAVRNGCTDVAEYLTKFIADMDQPKRGSDSMSQCGGTGARAGGGMRAGIGSTSSLGGMGSMSGIGGGSGQQFDSIASLPAAPPSIAPEVPAGVSSSLRGKCKEVMQKGWKNMQWPRNYTALHEAAEMGDVLAVEFLLTCGADPFVKDDANRTPLEVAQLFNKDKCADLLQRARPLEGTNILDAQKVATDRRATTYESVPQKGQATTGAGGEYGNDLSQQSHMNLVFTNSKLSRENNQLKEQLRRMEREDERTRAWELERQQLCARVNNLEMQVSTGKDGSQIGPLSGDQTSEYLKHLKSFGGEALRKKLQENELRGGLSLNEEEAASALEQMMHAMKSEVKGPPVVRPGVGMCVKCGGCSDGAVASSTRADGGDGSCRGGAGTGTGGDDGGKGGKTAPPCKGGKKGPAPPVPKGEGKGKPAVPTKGKGVGGKMGGKGDDKGKGKGEKGVANGLDPWARKPAITIARPMKPFWWTCLKLGQNLVEGKTLWDDVEDVVSVVLKDDILDDFVEHFSKNVTAAKKKVAIPDIVDPATMTSKKVGTLRIITDPALITGREAACRNLPTPKKLVDALVELNNVTLSTQILELVFENCVPTAAQLKQLQETRKTNPTVPWAVPESYMWEVGHVPAYEARIKCWLFARTYEEKVDTYMDAFLKVKTLIQSMLACKTFMSFLSLVLAFGNYLNGGTNRGQADGFELDALSKVESIKDNDGKHNLLHFLMNVILVRSDYFNDVRSEMCAELKPLFTNVRRRVIRDSDGAEKVEKQVMYVLEDFEGMLQTLCTEFEQTFSLLKMCLQYFEDPSDPLRTVLAEDFNQAKQKLDNINRFRKEVRNDFKTLQQRYNAETLSSTEFCLLWDNFLVPPDQLVNKPVAIKTKHVLPIFCQQARDIDLESLQVLWDLKKPKDDEEKKPKKPAAVPRRKSGVAFRGERRRRKKRSTINAEHTKPEKSANVFAQPA